MLKFEKDFKIPLETPLEEWVLILDLADNNYLKCIGLTQFLLQEKQREEKIQEFFLEKK